MKRTVQKYAEAGILGVSLLMGTAQGFYWPWANSRLATRITLAGTALGLSYLTYKYVMPGFFYDRAQWQKQKQEAQAAALKARQEALKKKLEKRRAALPGEIRELLKQVNKLASSYEQVNNDETLEGKTYKRLSCPEIKSYLKDLRIILPTWGNTLAKCDTNGVDEINTKFIKAKETRQFLAKVLKRRYERLEEQISQASSRNR